MEVEAYSDNDCTNQSLFISHQWRKEHPSLFLFGVDTPSAGTFETDRAILGRWGCSGEWGVCTGRSNWKLRLEKGMVGEKESKVLCCACGRLMDCMCVCVCVSV